MDLELSGRTAPVTGASKGMGLATVRALVAEGVKVAAVARTTSSDLAETGAIVVNADLSTAEGVLAGVGCAIEAIGDLDILVNNVGGTPPERKGMFMQLTDDSWTKGFDINFFAAVRTIRLAMPGLLRTKGNIVNVSSIGGRSPVNTQPDYAAAKAALTTFGKALNEEFGPQGVRGEHGFVRPDQDLPVGGAGRRHCRRGSGHRPAHLARGPAGGLWHDHRSDQRAGPDRRVDHVPGLAEGREHRGRRLRRGRWFAEVDLS